MIAYWEWCVNWFAGGPERLAARLNVDVPPQAGHLAGRAKNPTSIATYPGFTEKPTLEGWATNSGYLTCVVFNVQIGKNVLLK